MAALRRVACLLAVFSLGLSATALARPDRDALFARHAGGILRLTADASAGSVDPHINYQLKFWQVFAITYDGLVTFRKVAGDGANQIVPDLADAMPVVSNGGRTLVFHLHPGIRFSNGQLLTPDDVVASMVRLFKVGNPNSGSWFNVIEGGDACAERPAQCTLSTGVIADDTAGTVTFHLAAPDGEFLYKLGTPFGTILPAATPLRDLGTVPAPSTGPYMIASYNPQQLMRMVRNPYFHEWSVDAQPRGYPDEIDYGFGLQDEAEVSAVLNGQYDWSYEPTPTDRLAELGSKYQKQVNLNLLLQYYYAPMNTNLPPFDNVNARRALAYAIDRRATTKLFGGPHMARPTCQELPDNLPGHQAYCPFTLDPGEIWTKPDMDRARALMQASGTIGEKVTIITQDTALYKGLGEYLRSLLQSLGYRASVKPISAAIEFTYIQNTNNKVQISLTDWSADYPAASDFLNILFGCDSFHPGTDASVNMAGFCDRSIDAAMKHALATEATDTAAANLEWATIDRRITDLAPAVTLFQPLQLDLVSTRLGNFIWSAQYHFLFSQAWVR